MAKKKKDESDVKEVLPGTVEHARQEYFEREKAAYEERTGETVNFELSAPLTSTPLVEVVSDESTEFIESEDAGGSEDESTPPEGDQ
jgi:hypothetical protein